MLENDFAEIYTKFKLHFYKKIFSRFQSREASLTAVETFCVEAIYALNKPTINEFATFTQISAPNAAYKINNLIKKGYVRKIQSTEDKREYYLEVTDRFLEYYGISYDYIETVMKRIRLRFPQEDVAKLEEMLSIISEDLMEETQIPQHNRKTTQG
ncbi:MAG: MarR family transcriptional regulator [Clostridiales bacterium]